ncbi:MAG: gephyrin-like molybdotransferase Glp, partial [Candidatus Hydrothermarchaeales archaeon]
MKFLSIQTIDEAKSALHENFTPTPCFEKIGLSEALGRVLAENFRADQDVPPFEKSRMDGYAVIAEDTFGADETRSVKLEKIGSVAAGESSEIVVNRGQAVGIATGAPIPEGANAVVMVEYTSKSHDWVEVQRPVVPGENISSAASDILAGETLLQAGTVLASRHLGILAAQGIARVKVFKKPKIALLSTGSELVEPGRELGQGKIYDINTYSIAGRVAECGGTPVMLGRVEDRREALKSSLKDALKNYNIVITSGGTSKGAGDLLSDVVDGLGEPGVIVHGVSMKPGKPIIIGVIDGGIVFGLPGNPLSALMAFNVFASPVIRGLSGLGESRIETVSAKSALPLQNPGGRHVFLLVRLDRDKSESLLAYPVAKDSGAITALNEADGYIQIPASTMRIEKGEPVEVV